MSLIKSVCEVCVALDGPTTTSVWKHNDITPKEKKAASCMHGFISNIFLYYLLRWIFEMICYNACVIKKLGQMSQLQAFRVLMSRVRC